MHLAYFTTKCYPSTVADDIYAHNLAESLSKCSDNFIFYTAAYKNLKPNWVKSFYPFKKFRKIAAAFYLFLLLIKNKEITIFTNDVGLIGIIGLYKKFFLFTVVFDWHMLFSEKENIKILTLVDINITTSKRLLKNLNNIKKSKVVNVYGGVDMSYFNEDKDFCRNELNFNPNIVHIVYAGGFKTMGMEKGIKTMIDSLKYLDKKYKIILVGGRASEIKEYKEYAGNCAVADMVIIIGALNQKDISKYMLAADILVIPYPDEPHFREFGFPMKTFEYMASGNPIIYSKLDLIDEVLFDCATPFEPDSSKNLAEQILYITNNSAEALHNANLALKKVKKLTWKEKAENIYATIYS